MIDQQEPSDSVLGDAVLMVRCMTAIPHAPFNGTDDSHGHFSRCRHGPALVRGLFISPPRGDEGPDHSHAFFGRKYSVSS